MLNFLHMEAVVRFGNSTQILTALGKLLLAIMYINHRNVEDSMSDTYADVGT